MSKIDAASIISALEGNAETGMCHCPAHDDRRPSLHVTQAGNKVLVKCFAGCSQDAVIGALRGRGLWQSTNSEVSWDEDVEAKPPRR